MPLQNIPLAKSDFDESDWPKVVERCEQKECHIYSRLLFEEARRVESTANAKAQEIFTLLGGITSLTLKSDDKQAPFEPMFVWNDGSRGFIVDDLTTEHLQVLTEVASEVADPEMQARIADILWIRTCNFRLAGLAITAYLESAKTLEHPEHWVQTKQRVERAFRLAASIDPKKKGPFAVVIAYIEDVLVRYQGSSGFLLAELMELLQEHRLGDVKKYLMLTQQAIARAKAQHNWHEVRTYLLIQAKWHAMERDDINERTAKLAWAETWVKETEDVLNGPRPSYLLASAHLESAIHALRSVGGVPELVEQLHKRLLECQSHSLKEYKPIWVEIDSAVANGAKTQAEAQVKGKTLLVAIFELAFIAPSPKVEELQQQVEKMAKAAPLQHILPSQLVSSSGKTTDRSTPLLSNGADAQKALLMEKMFAQARMHQSGNAVLLVEPARKQINMEHDIHYQDLLPFLTDNPFVPPKREEIYAKGLAAGFAGDFLVATHLLIPQIENSLRTLLAQQGSLVSGLTSPRGIQDEHSLNTIFEQHREAIVSLFGEDITFDLEGLLIERFGTNLRNEVSHGLLDTDRFRPGLVSYFWWVALKLCFYHWLITDNEENPSSSQEHQGNA